MGRWVPGWFYEEDEADLIVYTYTVKEERGWTWCCGKCCFLLIVLALLAIPVCAVVLPMEAMLHCDCDWGLFSNQTYNFCYNEMYILDNDGTCLTILPEHYSEGLFGAGIFALIGASLSGLVFIGTAALMCLARGDHVGCGSACLAVFSAIFGFVGIIFDWVSYALVTVVGNKVEYVSFDEGSTLLVSGAALASAFELLLLFMACAVVKGTQKHSKKHNTVNDT